MPQRPTQLCLRHILPGTGLRPDCPAEDGGQRFGPGPRGPGRPFALSLGLPVCPRGPGVSTELAGPLPEPRFLESWGVHSPHLRACWGARETARVSWIGDWPGAGEGGPRPSPVPLPCPAEEAPRGGDGCPPQPGPERAPAVLRAPQATQSGVLSAVFVFPGRDHLHACRRPDGSWAASPAAATVPGPPLRPTGSLLFNTALCLRPARRFGEIGACG